MKGLQRFLEFINANYVSILVCVGLIIGFVTKVMNFMGKSDQEKIEIAKAQIHEVILRLITSAEIDFNEWNEAGAIKRSAVISEIFRMFPILSRTTSQSEIVDFIDNEINESLKTLRKIVKENNKPETTEEVIASTQVITSPGEANG